MSTTRGLRVRPAAAVAAILTLAASLALASAPSAAAATDATWTGGSTSSNLWTDAANWGGVAPGTAIGNLAFGDLATCDQGIAPVGSACYRGTDNLGPTTVDQIQIGGGAEYQIFPTSYDNPADTITLDGNGGTPNVGITASPSTSNLQLANFGIPIVLGAAQEWDISNYGLLYLNQISGSYPLTLNLNHGFIQANDIETSSVTASGPGVLQLDQFAGSPEKLPPVTVNDSIGPEAALTVASTNATSGPITISGTANNFIVLTDRAPGETRLQVNGDVTLDGTSNVEFDIDGNDTTPGTDSSHLTTSGTVNFNGAQISLWQGEDNGNCDVLTPGKSFTLLQGGTLTGQIKVGGKLISQGQSATETFQSNTCANAPKTSAIVSYNAHTLTAMIAGAPAASGQAPQISGTAAVGHELTVTGDGSWTGGPAPTYSYQWEACSGSSCAPIGGATKSRYALTSAEVGKTVKAQVTATNGYGSASAFSNALGPVTGTAAATASLRPLIRANLSRLAYPRGRRALRLLLRQGFYRTRFDAPAAGTLSVVWTTTLRTGHGRHARHHSIVVARGVSHAGGARPVLITIRLTGLGRRLLREHPFRLRITANERFLVPGLGWTSFRRRFTL